ncbi:hypothetical protein JDV02_008039 [Purpureocillium takamizusanense]|uniref:FAD-binding domain-containing protein n=1 Tax=Purpureocillium takamizusanense TaxID=2060973 RepID=A0A9Q8QJE4_9HYPO|nr:uncharacterized protein JDV02_008039 [Purpureocillium takamizusanense]UNI22119.1 hypothetical protein JDV02_008039 [Purpureocillium takamizusanense]
MEYLSQYMFSCTRSGLKAQYMTISRLSLRQRAFKPHGRTFGTRTAQQTLTYGQSTTLQSSLAMPLDILIVGAGICGPALAILLQNSDPSHDIKIIERSPSLRAAGQQIDLRGEGIEVLRKMGLLDDIKSHCVDETGLEIVDSSGNPTTRFGINPAGERRRTLTSEYEIMRGDVVKTLYEASLEQNTRLKADRGSKGGITYEFGKTLTDLSENPGGVKVTFSDGQKGQYDLVVAADGQGSRTRRLAFGEDVSNASFKSVGVHAAYYSIPRIEGEESLAKAYSALDRRLLVTRTSSRPVTQVLLFTMKGSEKLRQSYKESIEKQKEAFAEVFRDAGWQTDRVLTGMTACSDFYAHEVGQIKMKHLYKGRVALLGDAGYCPSPFTGMGTTGCLVGAYILAGELARNRSSVPDALQTYERIMQPLANGFQQMPTSALGIFFPSTKIGVWMLRKLLWAVSTIDRNAPVQQGNAKCNLPDYPELNL